MPTMTSTPETVEPEPDGEAIEPMPEATEGQADEGPSEVEKTFALVQFQAGCC